MTQPQQLTKIDVIGDVHGESRLLQDLLSTLGYRQVQGVWQHPERQVVFVGDLIDKGPDAAGVLVMIKSMVDVGSARVVVGNHELNLLRSVYEEALDLRSADFADALMACLLNHSFYDYPRLAEAFVDQPDLLAELFGWLQQQPLWLDQPGFRAVHACWDDEAIQCLQQAGIRSLSDAALDSCIQKHNPVYYALDLVVAGCQHTPLAHPDKRGFRTRRQRVRWWPEPLEDYESFELPLKREIAPVQQASAPVFFGHYSLRQTAGLQLVSEQQVCTDFGVAYGGPLVCYQHQMDAALDSRCFVAVYR